MRALGELKNIQIIILGVCIALATIVSTVILSKGLLQIKKFSSEVINVTGSAEKKITSDYAVWRASFAQRNPELKNAYAALREDLGVVKGYLLSQGIKTDELIISQINTQVLYKKNEKGNDTNTIEAYLLSQGIEVRSYDVAKVDNISRVSTDLINKDIAFISEAPQYFYTKLAELKI